MILILTDNEEPTTDLIISWLIKLNKPFIRFDNSNPIEFEEVFICNSTNKLEMIFSIVCNDKKTRINTKEITSFWYRRSKAEIKKDSFENPLNSKILSAVNEYLYIEKFELLNTLNHILRRKAKLNNFEDNYIFKLKVLDEALKVRLKVPNLIITNKKERIINFQKDKKIESVITKSIGDPLSLFHFDLYNYTSVLNLKNNEIPNVFYPSLVQDNIKKKYELRIFFFNETFYSSAIFSQQNKKSITDLKNYDSENPNRITPYKLPQNIENKLKKLFENLNLLSGSVDMIYSTNNEYVFLEINPIGQFEQVSHPCNYNIYKEIATYL
jgi:ATP-GRASP peptide maturase of grasp-with-spasm system